MRGKSEKREILAIDIEQEYVVIAEPIRDIVQAAVGIFLDAPEPGDVVLPAIVIACAEEAHAERTVLEQEPAEVGCDGLDADANAVEVVALGDIPEVLVDEQALDAGEAFGARLALVRIDLDDTELFDAEPGQVEDRQEADFVVGRLEYGLALVQHELGDQVLGEHELLGIAEHVDLAAIGRRGDGYRRRNAAALEGRIRNGGQREEPVFAESGPVTLEHVVAVVRIPPAFRVTERRHDTPAIRNRREVCERSPDGGLQSRLIAAVLVRRRPARPPAQAFLAESTVWALVVARVLGNSGCRREQAGGDGRGGYEFTCRRKHSARRYR